MAYVLSNKMNPANHKTVFVLDHTPYFAISCESSIEFEFLKGRTPTFMPMHPIHKSLWTCSVESAIEYCRIVWDLFPAGKLVKFIASDSSSHILNTWAQTLQSTNNIMNGLAVIGTPPSPNSQMRSPRSSVEFTVLHGLRSAVEALIECTETQHQKIQEEPGSKIQNRGRIICITSARDNDSMTRLEEILLSIIEQQNKLVAVGSDRFLPIDHCHLVIINTFPINIDSPVSSHPPKVYSPFLTVEVHSVKATQIANKLSSLILDHYDLGSTTVTGIPMKEEQNASSSANYDVEIFHASDAHTGILKGNASDSAAIKTVKDGFEYETVTLKWCTPRGCSASELQNCTAMHRITPVDVNSRPSLCLINFLLNGRSVMLEMPKKAGGKINSHLLASHGGEIFIHTLCTARSVLEDPPSISEGCGGRVTDYRITDFGILIQQNKLFPIKANYGVEQPIQKMKARLTRHTKYWPLTISSTLIFNLKGSLDPLHRLITREKLSDEEVTQCRQVIFNLITQETKHEPLNLPNMGQRSKGQKREEQYKLMWNELETLIKNNLHSENHRLIYKALLECHKFNLDDEKMETESADVSERVSVIRATTDSPMSPPPLASIATSSRQSATRSGGSTKSFLEIFMSQEKSKSRLDFYGRSNSDGPVAKLYPNFKSDNDWAPRETAVE